MWGSLGPSSYDRKHKQRSFFWWTELHRGPEQARHRCRGFWHTLAAEWFQLRISVITFRSVIYSWPLAATHDPHSPGDLIKGGGSGCANTAISELQWIYCLLLLSCLGLSCITDTRRERGFILQDLALPAWIYSPDRDPTNDTPAIPRRPPLSSTPAVYLWELGTHMCYCTAHKLNARLKRKNPNRKREKENKNERVGKRTAVNHVLKSPAAGGRESAWPVYRSNWPAQKLAWNQVSCKPLITERTSLTTRRGHMSLRQLCSHPHLFTKMHLQF